MSDGGDYRDSYKQAWLAFSHAVRSGLPSPCSFASGWIAMEGSNAAVESCASRLPVRCQKIVASDASSAIGAAESLVPVAGAECGEESTVFSVLVPTFDRPRHLPRLLDSLARQTFSKERFEVVIVNDGGRKPLDEIVGAYRDRLRIVSIVLERSLGCSGARRKAFEAASGRYLAFTDDDCRPVPSWLSDAYRHVSGNPSTAVAGPTVNALTGNLFSEATQVVVQWAASKRCERGGGLEFSPTSNLIFRRERLIAAGGLRDDWKIPGGEDRDLCRRWIQAGGTIRFEASAIVHHFHQLDLAGFLRQHFGYGRGAARFRWMERSDLRNDSRSLEGWSFYAGLLREPFRTQSIRRAFALTALLVLSQVATLAGVIRELLSHLPSASNGGVFAPKETSIQ
jgi:glycosyltransferase involved in cell wall biosynthesis